MNRIEKTIAVLILAIISVGLSYWIVTEVAGFYLDQYPGEEIRGWYASIIPEVIMILFMAINIPITFKTRFFSIKKEAVEIPILNILTKTIVAAIFFITIIVAGLYVLKPSFDKIEKSSRDAMLLNILKDENSDLKKDSAVFSTTKQRLNSAVTSKAKRKNRDELKQLVKNMDFTTVPMLTIFSTFGIRIVIQISNLIIAFLIGWIYRQPSSRIKSTDEAKKTEVIEPEVLKLTETAELDELEPIIPEIIEPEAPALKAVPKKIFNNAVKGYGGRFASKIDRSPP